MSPTDMHSQTWANAIVPQPQSTLLSLPGEIRNNIWKKTLTSPQQALPYWLHDSTSYGYVPLGSMEITCGVPEIEYWSYKKDANKRTYASIVITCRQMFADVVGGDLFYKSNAFSLDVLERNKFYFLGQRKLDCITSLHFTWRRPLGKTPEHTPQLFQDLARCKNLKHLVLSLYTTVIGYEDTDAEGEETIRISDASLSRIRNVSAFKTVKGLQTFELRLKAVSESSRHILAWRSSRNPASFESPMPLGLALYDLQLNMMQEEQTRFGLHNDAKLRQLEADLRAMMTRPRLDR